MSDVAKALGGQKEALLVTAFRTDVKEIKNKRIAFPRLDSLNDELVAVEVRQR